MSSLAPFSLLAGLSVGPISLPDSPIENVDTIRLLADLGLVLLLFGIGLELGWQRIRQVGSQVIIIGLVEMTIMFALGYQVATLLGWTVTERVFLGAALCISSSAILVKMLRDTGNLLATQGRLIVGILVVEDFAAVILLTVLSGVATTGATSTAEVGMLILKLAIFTVCALVFGAIFAPKLVRLANQFRSDETLLVASLALCFGLALAGQVLGLSAAAGAFLIGTVLGDTDSSTEIDRIVRPVRDMFAAIFFVSIGMLMDLSQFMDFIIPALIVSAVFIAGKVVADTVGTILSGHSGRTALRVGMGMPQVGEFSLAMTKVGVEQGAVGAFLNPIITLATGLTALLYPFIFRSADGLADLLERHSPQLMKRYGGKPDSLPGHAAAGLPVPQSPRPARSALGAVDSVEPGNHRGDDSDSHGNPAVQRPAIGVVSPEGGPAGTHHRRSGAGPVRASGGGHLAVAADSQRRHRRVRVVQPRHRLGQLGRAEPAQIAAGQHPDSHLHPARHLGHPPAFPVCFPWAAYRLRWPFWCCWGRRRVRSWRLFKFTTSWRRPSAAPSWDWTTPTTGRTLKSTPPRPTPQSPSPTRRSPTTPMMTSPPPRTWMSGWPGTTTARRVAYPL